MPASAVIRLPPFVFEDTLPGYIGTLLAAGDAPAITLDFERIKYFIPGAVVATLAQVRHWRSQGQTVKFVNHDTNPVCGYLQRIDFFKHVGFELPEPGERHYAGGRFVPIEEIGDNLGRPEDIASKMAECVSPGGYLLNEPFQLVQYAGGEIVTNCKQHAKGAGFVSAQYSPKQDFARLAIADCGRGIRRSFEENNSPHFREGMADAEAIATALRPRVSSTTHLPHAYGASPNKGVGWCKNHSGICCSSPGEAGGGRTASKHRAADNLPVSAGFRAPSVLSPSSAMKSSTISRCCIRPRPRSG